MGACVAAALRYPTRESLRAHIREKCGNAKLQTGGQQDANGDSLNVLQNYEAQPNFGNNVAYFRTGDVGHTVTWTVGYVEEFSTDFEGVGSVSASDIENGRLISKYDLEG